MLLVHECHRHMNIILSFMYMRDFIGIYLRCLHCYLLRSVCHLLASPLSLPFHLYLLLLLFS
jgi:hypothetical protein